MSELNLFGDESTELVLPSSNTEYENRYELDKLLLGKKVKVLNIKECSEVEQPNIILNFDKLGGKMTVMQREAVKSVKVDDGEYTLYIYTEKLGLVMYGKTSGSRLQTMCYMKKNVFGDKMDIYRNFNPETQELETVDEREIRDLRLRL